MYLGEASILPYLPFSLWSLQEFSHYQQLSSKKTLPHAQGDINKVVHRQLVLKSKNLKTQISKNKFFCIHAYNKIP